MDFSDTFFLLFFFPVAFALYWLSARNVVNQNRILLLEGLAFYALINWKLVPILVLCIAITYFSGLSGKKQIIVLGICVNILGLFFFKYGGFFIGSVVLPVGMSFYVFQSTGYLIDVYKKKSEAEKDFVSLALFMCFFPTITAGPILRYNKMIPQIRGSRTLSFHNFQKAVIIFCYGLFLKLVLANRIAVLVDKVFGSYRSYSGQILFVGCMAYAIQLYADFAGYSYMAQAIALAYDFNIPENFRQPFLALSFSDLWKRWHISLSSWLRDYIYIPLGGNRKGRMRKYINLFITFLISGIWHGAGLNFVIWGIIIGTIIVVEDLSGFVKGEVKGISRVFRSLYVFIAFSITFVFFRADSFITALSYLKRMFTRFGPWELTDGVLLSLGIDEPHLSYLILFIMMVCFISIGRERGLSADTYCRQSLLIKCLGFLLMATVIAGFGNYGIGYDSLQFIYAGF